MEGFGKGFMNFLDEVESKVKMPIIKYKKPETYDFLKDEYEVALSEG